MPFQQQTTRPVVDRCGDQRQAPEGGKKIAVVGAGTTGSRVAQLLGDIPRVTQVHFIDGGVYEASNLGGQAILPRDVGQPKAVVQARRLRQLNPRLRVTAHVEWVEHVPWEILRCDALLSCVDSRIARQWINEITWRLGVLWLDLAVDAAQLLARVNVYQPGSNAPCLECAWNDDDYAALEQVYACGPDHAASAPTRAPAGLGALPAALAATELRKLFGGESAGLLTGRQVLCDLRHHEYWVTRFQRTPTCRFDHQPWSVTPFPCAIGRLSWRTFLRAVCPDGNLEGVSVRVAGQSFVRTLGCSRCGPVALEQAVLEHRLPPHIARCVRCHEPLHSADVDAVDWLPASRLASGHAAGFRLADAGVRLGDILCIDSPGGQRHVALTTSARRKSRRDLSPTGAPA